MDVTGGADGKPTRSKH